MPSTLPTQTAEDLAKFQRKAMEARIRYAETKQQLKHGERSLKFVLDDDGLQRMRVRDVIAALPGMGKNSTEKLMDKIGIAKSRRISGLGARQYKALLDKFGE